MATIEEKIQELQNQQQGESIRLDQEIMNIKQALQSHNLLQSEEKVSTER